VTVGRVPSPDGRQIHVQLGSALPDGFVIYAREYPGRGFLTFATGPSNKESYDLVLPMRMPETSTFEVALVDSRGCDDCSAGQWKYEFSPHDPSVDALP
jgi:hypothetical protein